METLLSWMEYYIDLYYKINDFNNKVLIFKSISVIYKLSKNYNDFNNKYVYLINTKYNNFINNNPNIENELYNYYNKLNENRFMSVDDINFLKELLNKLNRNYIKNYINNYNRNKLNNYDIFNPDLLYSYINYDECYNRLISYMKNRIIKDKHFKKSYTVDFYDNNDFLILNSNSMIDYIHELTHVYTKNLNNKYIETPSIMMELGIESYYKLGDKHNRIDILCQYGSSYLNSDVEDKEKLQMNLEYFMGTIVALSFINNYGCDFRNIKYAIDIICSYSKFSLRNMLNILNIKENDIINAFNNKEKILCKR